ncbi:MAG TPA: class I SAM-dependent methyltransferase [Gemmatimonadales bacterium]|nr:class I SAM-dependent methyltransferase [Gemmatimonadales bacterium]
MDRGVLSQVVASYYDGFRDRLLDDYRNGNVRVSRALTFAAEALGGAKSVLDIGCGIGWTTHELSKPGVWVTGLDISPDLIKTARGLFPLCDFICADFTQVGLSEGFDAVVMVDVYEHFPRELRPVVHDKLRSLLGERLVMTVPTPEALQYARDRGIPLQLVDEDVTQEDVEQLAADIGGKVEINELVSIWRPDDYRHVLIVR